MSDDKDKQDLIKEKELNKNTCCSTPDPFASLPPDLRPKQKNWKDEFRKVTCPNCGLVYWTQDSQDLCTDCKKTRHIKANG